MNDTHVTLQGWVGGDVDLRDAGGVPVASFRVGSTPRFQRGGEWVDGETQWFSVSCWRGLAANVAESVHKGDAVVVHGRLRVESWGRPDGTTATTWTVVATSVGHDLSRGRSRFVRTARQQPGDVPVEQPPQPGVVVPDPSADQSADSSAA